MTSHRQRDLALLTFAILTLGVGCEPADTPDPEVAEDPDGSTEAWYGSPEQPEIPSGYHEKPGWDLEDYGVAAAHPLAADAGAQVLEAGGSAVDAGVAVQAVLTLVEPQSSGIGGGAFLLHWDGAGVDGYNGRETAPAAADETLFLDDDGEPLAFGDAVNSGRSVGVPGTLAMLYAAHQEHGELPWADLFEPAITLAEDGFEVSPRLSMLLNADATLRDDPVARELYYDDDGDAHPEGYELRNPALAEVLRGVAEEGLDAFYQGPVAEDIAARVQAHPDRPGEMAPEDIEAYPELDPTVEAICTPWRDYDICGFPPPTSGHLAVAQILGLLDGVDAPADALDGDDVPTAEWLHPYLEAAKLAFADRDRYVADPDFVDPPAGDWESLLVPAYLEERAGLVAEESMGEADPGDPGQVESAFGRHPDQPERGTSHVSIVDSDGNAVSMTMTIEQGFGSRIMSDGGTGLEGGFHLNNELTDFSLTPEDDDGRPIANRPEAGKRPRSSMSPTLVLDETGQEFVAATGSPGGAGIIHYTTKSLLGMLAWDLNAQEAIDVPNFVNYNGPSTLEEDRFDAAVLEALEARGHEVSTGGLGSGIHAIQRTEDGYFGGADPRREGVVEGR